MQAAANIEGDKSTLPITVIGVISLTVLVWIFWAIWTSFQITKEIKVRAIEFEQISGQIIYLDEVLTNSARLAASTGDVKWEERYRAHISLLDESINNLIAISGDISASTGVQQTHNANTILVAMEEDAFTLVRKGQLEFALAVLESDAYQTQKTLYAAGMEKFVTSLRDELNRNNANELRNVNLLLLAATCTVILVVLCWLVIFKFLYQQRMRLFTLNRKLASANSARSTFLATMSHEIRTPLNGILGASSLLDKNFKNTESAYLIQIINDSGSMLLQLLNNILDISKLDAEKVELEETTFQLSEVVQSMENIYALKARDKCVEFKVHIDEGISDWRFGDPLRLKQILHNLLSNSMKFTHQGKVCLSIYEAKSLNGNIPAIAIAVLDTGIGIAEDQTSRIFESFTQADDSTTRHYGGSGLGLSIVKGIVDKMGGTITVQSQPNIGTRFDLILPLQIVEHATRFESKDLENNSENDLHGVSILIVDDNITNQKIFDIFLQQAGASTTIANNGRIAVEIFQPGKFDIILMDIQMPEMDGIESFQMIRSIDQKEDLPLTPIIAVTANAMEDQIQHYLSIGFEDHIGKPVTKKTLLELVCRHTYKGLVFKKSSAA